MFEKIKSFLFKNTTASQTAAKNTFWLAVSNFGGRLVKAAIILYAARALGTAGYGVFSYAVTLAGFVSLFMDPGVNSVLTRDIAKAPTEEREKIFSTSFIIKLVLLAIGASVILFIGPYFSTLPGAIALLPVVAAIVTFDTLREFVASLLRGMEKMEWEAVIYIFTNFAIVIFGFIFIRMHPTAAALGWGYAIGTILGAIAAIILVRDYLKDMFTHFSGKLALSTIQSAWPFAVTGALGLLFTNTDILIISWMRTASDVGIYSAAIRVIQVLYLVPGIIQTSTLPIFSRFVTDKEKFRRTLERTVGIVFLLSIPLMVGGVILGTQILSFLFGADFATGGLAFKILMVSMVVDYPGAIIANAIFTYSQQRSLIFTAALGGSVNVLLDILLIPRFGMTGSAISTLVAQCFANGYLWYVMRGINPFSVLPYLKKTIIATVGMALAVIAMKLLGVQVLVNIAVGTIVYLGLLVGMKDSLIGELRLILRSDASVARADGE